MSRLRVGQIALAVVVAATAAAPAGARTRRYPTTATVSLDILLNLSG